VSKVRTIMAIAIAMFGVLNVVRIASEFKLSSFTIPSLSYMWNGQDEVDVRYQSVLPLLDQFKVQDRIGYITDLPVQDRGLAFFQAQYALLPLRVDSECTSCLFVIGDFRRTEGDPDSFPDLEPLAVEANGVVLFRRRLP